MDQHAISEEHCRKLERMYLGCPINRAMYPSTWAEFTEEAVTISLEVDGNQFHAMGAAHGSIYFKLMDDAAYFAAQVHVEDSYLLTASMNLNFTRPVTGGRIECRGQIVHRGRRMLVAEAELLDAGGHLLATGRGTFMPSGKPLEPDFGYR
ncbi:MAG: PaaI family thioesterase [Crocinitomicaceae bacterium TMED114]|nr:MAG: PaaI family thioesterase [Crocinitomicaceae bacterium TMED114]